MSKHLIKKADQLSDTEITTILTAWEIEEWKSMKKETFREKFKDSMFHLLTDSNDTLLSVARINQTFSLSIKEDVYDFAEFVGFVAIKKNEGFGSGLLQLIKKQAKQNEIQLIGFCKKELRPFYKKNDIELLEDQAFFILEKENGEWIPSTDDDILVLNLSQEQKNLLSGLTKDKPACLVL